MIMIESANLCIQPRSRRGRPGSGRLVLLLLALSMLAGGCRLRGKPVPADRPVPSNEVLDFRQLYGQNCAGCHGASGQMGPAPPLNDELFRSIIPENELLAVVSAGRKGTLMPAFEQDNGGTLTRNQVQVLVNEIKGVPYKIVEKTPGDLGSAQVVADANGLMPKWGKPAPAGPSIPPYLISAAIGQKQQGDAGKGMAVFTRVCADCHGEKGEGIDAGGQLANAINDPVFLALNSNQVLRRIIITGRADLGMPGFAIERPDFKPLTSQEISDLVALLASWRQGSGSRTTP